MCAADCTGGVVILLSTVCGMEKKRPLGRPVFPVYWLCCSRSFVWVAWGPWWREWQAVSPAGNKTPQYNSVQRASAFHSPRCQRMLHVIWACTSVQVCFNQPIIRLTSGTSHDITQITTHYWKTAMSQGLKIISQLWRISQTTRCDWLNTDYERPMIIFYTWNSIDKTAVIL